MKINIKYYLCLLLTVTTMCVIAQNPAPGKLQMKPIALTNAHIVVGNGTVIPNGIITFRDGIIENAGVNVPFNASEYEVINLNGKHVYPGLISPNSQVGLNEIAAVRTTQDYAEIGDYNPNVRSIIAYNTDSEVIPTVRGNGILVAQVTPVSGIISGTSSVVYNDGWNWEDAALKMDEGVWLNWPNLIERSFNRETFQVENKKNEKYLQTVAELKKLFSDAVAYSGLTNPEANLKLEALRGLFDGTKKLYVNANGGKQIVEAIQFATNAGVKNLVIVGAEDADLAIPLLKEKQIPVIVNSTQRMPNRVDEAVWSAYELPKKLMDAGLTVGMYYNDSYWRSRNLGFVAGNAAAFGMDKKDALKMVTLNNAKIMGIDDVVGSLEKGKHATLLVTEGDILDMRTAKVEKAYIKGREVNLDDKQKRLYEKYKEKYELD